MAKAAYTPKQQAGNYGEDLAASHLALHGYACVARGYRSRFGEIDIIAQNDRYLLFVEVKTRRASAFAGAGVSAREAVDYRKRQRLTATAEFYLASHHTALQPRFDVICVELNAAGACVGVEWIENAF